MNPRHLAIVALAAVGCTSPTHLQYDFGRAYTQSVSAQADLTRPSVADMEHPLGGVEAAAIRLQARKATSDEETGESELQQGVQ